jgi:hypothetical protein
VIICILFNFNEKIVFLLFLCCSPSLCGCARSECFSFVLACWSCFSPREDLFFVFSVPIWIAPPGPCTALDFLLGFWPPRLRFPVGVLREALSPSLRFLFCGFDLFSGQLGFSVNLHVPVFGAHEFFLVLLVIPGADVCLWFPFPLVERVASARAQLPL